MSLFDVSDYDTPEIPAAPEVEPEPVEQEAVDPAVMPVEAVPEPVEVLGAEIVGAEVLDPDVIADVGGAGAADAVVVMPALEPDEEILREPSVDALWSEVIGQGEAVALLRASTMAPVHAYFFAGPAGVGKLVAARSFAAALLCPRGGCGRCSVCVRAMAEAYPDLVVVEREGASITVDQAREIVRLAMRSPIEGPRKVLVLVDFHLVTAAAPTLLKIIEEPPPSTVFVVLAEQITPELVTIASRCIVVPFAVLGRQAIIGRLMAEGAEESQAERAAGLAGGRLDRARLLVAGPDLGSRLEFWERIPSRLDGTGAAVSVVVTEAMALLDQAVVGPLAARQEGEVAALEARLEAVGARGGTGSQKELAERHKREQKRVRDDELRFGLGVLSRTYATAAATPSPHQFAALKAVERIGTTNTHLERNPNLILALQSLFLHLA